MIDFDLGRAVELLQERFGRRLDAPYEPGKTMFRDALFDSAGLSQEEAEVLCDSLERAELIRFVSTELEGDSWIIDDVVNVATLRARSSDIQTACAQELGRSPSR